jgi:hypothetical protein
LPARLSGTNPLPRASTGQLTAGNYHTRKLLLHSLDGHEAPTILAEGSPSTGVVVAHGNEPKRMLKFAN